MRFHRICGDRITLLEDDLIAVRNIVEYQNGVVLSSEPLPDDVLFEIQIKGKITIWNGGIEMGITTLDPVDIDIPPTASVLRNTAWIMSGSSILKDGVKIQENYGPELDRLREGDTVGVMRTSQSDLLFFVNGRCLGVAAVDIPSRVFAVVDLYGQCIKARVINPPLPQPPRVIMSNLNVRDNAEINSLTSSSSGESIPDISILFSANDEDQSPTPIMTENNRSYSITMDEDEYRPCVINSIPEDNLLFHPRCGSFVRIFDDQRSAERARPHDEYNNGVILTNRPLYPDELFEIRIDKIIDKWSGSIEVGVTTHNPATIKFPSTMTNMDTGTIMLSGCKILVNGCGTSTDYSKFNLDELKEGDRVGIMRRLDGKLHFYINGVDQGLAAENLKPLVWGVVDLYGMTVKVSIVDEADDNNRSMPDLSVNDDISHLTMPRRGDLSLSFHTMRNSNVVAINDNKTAHRPHAYDYYTNGVIMTNRTLKTDELFQVRIDVIIPKWGGGIEIGVTELTCNDIPLPYKIISLKELKRRSTWSIVGSDVIKDGVAVIPHYVRPLEHLMEGDTIGVMRKDMGILHFYINGQDQGPAAFNIPEHVYGIVDLVGRVSQVSIHEAFTPRLATPETPNSETEEEMRFYPLCAPNGNVSLDGMTANRVAEYNFAVFFSSRPLKENEMFEFRIDKLYHGNGTLGFGVTAAKPEDIDVCSVDLATVLPADTYVLSGDCLMKSIPPYGKYTFDLNIISIGTRVGLMRLPDKNIHFYIDGQDQGAAFWVSNADIYAVVDLYGACTQVTLLPIEECGMNFGTNADISLLGIPWNLISLPQPYCFSEYCGENVLVLESYSIARRRYNAEPGSSLVFSAAHLVVGEIFEIKMLDLSSPFCGQFRMGITDVNILNALVNKYLPQNISLLPHFTAYIEGRQIKYTSPCPDIPAPAGTCVPSLEWVRDNDRIGFKKAPDGRVLIYLNSEFTGSVFEDVPDRVYVVMELYGQSNTIQAVSKLGSKEVTLMQPSAPIEVIEQMANNEYVPPPLGIREPVVEPPPKFKCPFAFSFMQQHGLNITLCSSDTVAIRTTDFYGGLVITKQRLKRGRSFMFRVDKMNNMWAGSLAVGALGSIRNLRFPLTAYGYSAHCWVISEDAKNIKGKMFMSNDGEDLQYIREQSILCLHFDYDGNLYLTLDEKYRMLIGNVPKQYKGIYPLIDIYGQIRQVSIVFHKMSLTGSDTIRQPSILEYIEERDDLDENVMMRTSFSEDDLLVRANNMDMPWSFIPTVEEVLEEYVEEEEENDEMVSRQYDSNIVASNIEEESKEQISPINPAINQAALEEAVYFSRLLQFVNPESELFDTLDSSWMAAKNRCAYMNKVYIYWQYLTEMYKNLGVAMSSGIVKCYCINCEPEVLQYPHGWVRVEAAKELENNLTSRDGIFWHPMPEAFEGKVEFIDDPAIFAMRPAFFHLKPKIMPQYQTTLWCTEADRVFEVSVSVEINLGGIRDVLSAILLHVDEITKE